MYFHKANVFELTEQLISFFWKRVQKSEDPNGCWIWTGRKGFFGYGRVRVPNGRTNDSSTGAHRISWAIAHGSFPEKDLLHKCDVPACVNPRHLVEGSQQDNVADMLAKGRKVSPLDREHPNRKLNPSLVIELRQRWLMGERVRALAVECGVSEATLNSALRGKRWKVSAPLVEGSIPPPAYGVHHHSAKLDPIKVVAIRTRAANGENKAAMAREFGLEIVSLEKVIARKTWKHVP